MLDVYEIVKEKEAAIAQLRREVEALRMVCPMLQDENDSIRTSFESSTGDREEASDVAPVSEPEAILASIRIRLMEARLNDPPKQSRSVFLQFREAALVASRALLKRIPRSRFSEKQDQGNAIGNQCERFGSHAA